MKSRNERQRLRTGALAVLIVAAIVLTIPMIVSFGSRNNELLITGAKVLASSGDSFTLSEPVQLLAGPQLIIRSGTISLADASDQKVVDGRARAALLLSGRARLVVDNAVITVGPELTASKKQSQDAQPIAPFVAALGKLAFESLRIRRGTVIMNGNTGGSEILSEVNATAHLRASQKLRVAGNFHYKGEKLDFQTRLGQPVTASEPARRRLATTLSGRLIKANADGIITLGNNLKFETPLAKLDVASIGEAARWLGTNWPLTPELNSFTANGHMIWEKGRIFFDNAKFSLGTNSAEGALGFSVRTGRPVIDGTLAFETLDLKPYIESSNDTELIGPMTAFSVWWPPFSNSHKKVWLPFVRELDADLRISADRVVTGKLDFGRSAASVSINDGKMLADIAETIPDAGGRASGQFTIDTADVLPRYGVRGKIEGLDITQSALAMFGHPVVEGIATIAIDLSATGNNQTALSNSCKGKVGIELNEGARLGVDIARLKDALGKQPSIAGWGDAVRGKTQLETLSAHFTIAGGKLAAQAITAKSATKMLAAAGSISLRDKNMEVRLWYEPRPQETGNSNSLNGPDSKIRPIRISGPWKKPGIRSVRRPVDQSVPRALLGGPKPNPSQSIPAN